MTSSYRRKIEKNYGIILYREDVIHHINLNREDNNLDNLYITDKKTHRKMHSNCYIMMVKLLQYHLNNGDVIFKNEQYIIKNKKLKNKNMSFKVKLDAIKKVLDD